MFTNSPEAQALRDEDLAALQAFNTRRTRILASELLAPEASPMRPHFWITMDGGTFHVTDRAGIFKADRAFANYWCAETYVLGCLAWHSGDFRNGSKMIALTDYDRWAQRPRESWMR